MSDDTPIPDAPEPQYERFDSGAAFQAALERLLVQSGRELRIFDPTLESLQLNSPARIGLLEAFLQASRAHRLYVVVHDTGYVTTRCPRMIALLTRYAHAVQVNRTHEHLRHLQDAFVVLDSQHYLRRPVARFYRGAIGLHDETEALAMRARFQEIWDASFPAVSPTTVGL